jgi:hypothetical protein
VPRGFAIGFVWLDSALAARTGLATAPSPVFLSNWVGMGEGKAPRVGEGYFPVQVSASNG